MRRWVPVALMVVGVAAGVTSAAAQSSSRMTFKCHNEAASPCVDGGRFFLNDAEAFLLGVYDSGFSPPPANADGWDNALFMGTGDIRYYRGLKDIPINDAMQNLSELVNELDTLQPALLATPTAGALLDVTPKFASAPEWRIAALRSVIPLISNYADKQWYQAELNALTATPPDESLSPMLHQTPLQKSYIRTRVTVVNGVGYVIAYNYGNTAINGATFTWNAIPKSVEVVGESRMLQPAGTTFTDSFSPYQAHVYIVR